MYSFNKQPTRKYRIEIEHQTPKLYSSYSEQIKKSQKFLTVLRTIKRTLFLNLQLCVQEVLSISIYQLIIKKLDKTSRTNSTFFYFCLALYSREDMPVMCIISDAFPCFLCGRRYNDLKYRFMDPDPAALVGLGS